MGKDGRTPTKRLCPSMYKLSLFRQRSLGCCWRCRDGDLTFRRHAVPLGDPRCGLPDNQNLDLNPRANCNGNHDDLLLERKALSTVVWKRKAILAGAIPSTTNQARYRLTPLAIVDAFNKQCSLFDLDRCLCAPPEGYSGLSLRWGAWNLSIGPFHQDDGVYGQGPTTFVRKAITEQQMGKTSGFCCRCNPA